MWFPPERRAHPAELASAPRTFVFKEGWTPVLFQGGTRSRLRKVQHCTDPWRLPFKIELPVETSAKTIATNASLCNSEGLVTL
eukprot:2921187-Pyramimonas_sp.AAC.1